MIGNAQIDEKDAQAHVQVPEALHELRAAQNPVYDVEALKKALVTKEVPLAFAGV